MTQKQWIALEKKDPNRAYLARAMKTYLNYLDGATERDEFEDMLSIIKGQERVILAQLYEVDTGD